MSDKNNPVPYGPMSMLELPANDFNIIGIPPELTIGDINNGRRRITITDECGSSASMLINEAGCEAIVNTLAVDKCRPHMEG